MTVFEKKVLTKKVLEQEKHILTKQCKEKRLIFFLIKVFSHARVRSL